MTEDDIEFRASRPTPPPRPSPAVSSTASPCSPRSRVQALERDGSHVLFSSADFPGTSPTTSSPPPTPRPSSRTSCRSWSTPGTSRSTGSTTNPDEATAIMAEGGGVDARGYEAFAEGTTIFDAQQALDSLRRPGR